MDIHPCRFCKNDDSGLIKYGPRHYAHGRCLIIRRAGPGASEPDVRRVLDGLSLFKLGSLRPLQDFDSEDVVGTMSAVGMTGKQFMKYYRERQAAERKRDRP